MERFAEQTTRRVFNGALAILVYGNGNRVYYQSEAWPIFVGTQDLPEAEGVLRHDRRPFEERPMMDFFRRERLRRGEPPQAAEIHRTSFLKTFGSGQDALRVAVFGREGHNVAVGIRLVGVFDELATVQSAFLWSLPAALGLIGFGAWLLAGRALRPIEKLSQVATEVSASQLDTRIENDGEDREFERLIASFNAMLDRLDRSFAQANRFSADAAHELRTPLTILQGHIEMALQDADAGSGQSNQQRFEVQSAGERLRAN